MNSKFLILLFVLTQITHGNIFAKGFEKCDIPEKWIFSVVKANGGSTIEAAKIPKNVLRHLDPSCMDDITDATFKENLTYPQIVAAIKKAQGARSKK